MRKRLDIKKKEVLKKGPTLNSHVKKRTDPKLARRKNNEKHKRL